MTESTYDYILCGGGTSALPLAARLAAASHKILILEAGAHNSALTNSHMPAALPLLFADETTHWNITSEPLMGAAGQTIPLFRGKFLGGSSGANGTLCVRGSKLDYDDWGVEGWEGEVVHEAMRRAERFLGEDEGGVHGREGSLRTERVPLAGISEKVMRCFEESGLEYQRDLFTTCEKSTGCGEVIRSTHKGMRSTAADFITDSSPYKHNITIQTSTIVDKVNFTHVAEDDQQPLATSVDTINTKTNLHTTISATREIILCAGTYSTPPILLRSGLGPLSHLAEHNIPCLVDLPGVGQNLQDHPIVYTWYETTPESASLTTNDTFYGSDGPAAALNEWSETKTGFMSKFPFGAFAFARVDKHMPSEEENWRMDERGRDPMGLLPDKQPSVEFWNTECYYGPPEFAPKNGEGVFGLVTELFSPLSRGSVRLRGRDAGVNPRVECAYFTDSGGRDLGVMVEGVRMGDGIVRAGMGGVVRGAWPMGEKGEKTEEEWRRFVKEGVTTCYHPVGTARMAQGDDDGDAVVDSKLRVRGVRGLRVVDCSVVPKLPGGHTQMIAYAIGERAADFILGGE